MMTAAQLHDARMLIPGAYEPNLHRATQPAPPMPVATPYVVAASAQPTSRLGYAVSILGDVALGTAVIFAVALVPILAVQGIRAAAALILGTFGGR